MFDTFSGLEILTIAVVALVVFGPNRLPEIARTIGRYVRELREAVRDLREGIEREVAPMREPIKDLRQELTEGASDVKRTLAETADAAASVERDIRRSVKDTGRPAPDEATSVPEVPEARWVAPEPQVGVSPSEVWEGLDDPMPENVVAPEASGPPPENGQDGSAENPPAGEGDQAADAPAGHDGDEPPDKGE